MRKIRYLDKLIDELAKGKSLAAVLRSEGDEPAAKTTKKARSARSAP